MKMKIEYIVLRLTFLFILSNAFYAEADIRLPAIIADNMVLQQKTDAVLWGWADPNEEIEIIGSWNNQRVKIKTSADGKWLAKIKTAAAGGPYTLSFKATNTITFTDVYLGEVWFCSGQSNMEWKIKQTQKIDSISEMATNPLIRMFTVKRATAQVPQEDVVGRWVVNSPSAVLDFSAIAYHFGNELATRLDIPIGLIHSSWGGTPAEAWVNKEVLESSEIFKPILARHQKKIESYDTDKNKQGNEKLEDPRLHYQSPAVLYNAMLKPLLNYRIKGVIWYQGESNASRAYQYRKLFPALIAHWRTEFKINDLPFHYVQIAPFKGQNPEIREAQLMTLKTSDNVGMAVTTDVGDCDDIHPRNKIPVGKRLAYIALNKNYNQKEVEWQSPMYRSHTIEQNKIRVYFDTDSKLVPTAQLREFVIAGEDQKFYAAKAVVEGKTVVVYHEDVAKPVAVRFAWQNCPDPNLFNEGGLPASPFRTDEWKGSTEGAY